MNAATIYVEKKVWNILDLPVIVDPVTLTDKVLHFCQQWTIGKETFLMQTSGSTGTPKIITLDRAGMIASATSTAQVLKLHQGQTSLVCLDTDYIAGRMMLVRSLEVGMNMIIAKPSANPFEGLPDVPFINFCALVPYQVKAILDSSYKEYFNQIELILVGGAPLDEATKLELQNYSCQFYETYGMTETISHIALKKINGINKSDYFEVVPNIAIRQDERACLCIKAPYLKDEISTNDVVEMVSQSQFIWLGRLDNVINSGGVKIFPEATEKKIESLFSMLTIPNAFIVAGLPDLKLGQIVTLIIEGVITNNELAKIEEGLKKSLDKFETPRSIRFVKQFQRTETSKINRKQTLAQLAF